MTVARGMGGEGSAGCVANGHMTVGRWGKGGALGEGGEGQGQGGGGGGGGGEGGSPAGGPAAGSMGARRAHWHKARRLATGLKKNRNSVRPGPLTINGPIGSARTGLRA